MTIACQTNRTRFRDEVLAPLLAANLLEMTVPDKPRSPKQRYRVTEAGREAGAERSGGRPSGVPA